MEDRMQTIKVHDNAIVLVLNKSEAKALKLRLNQHTRAKKSKALVSAEEKLLVELGEL
jgi:hypothetical protein